MQESDAGARSLIVLPEIPVGLRDRAVAAWSEPVAIDSYLPADADPYPAFLDSRVYQGSSGRVYPLPFHERISGQPRTHRWQAVHLENEWLRLMIMPELGGRIHIAYDKVAKYDIFYRNNVIKPALVGLAGPWISGGVEFNWPQHHRPATFLPTDVHIEHEPDGSVTVWCSDHDPFARMKGMHGIRLRPDSSLIEARVRLYNRSDTPQSFLWWANVAVAVNDNYQSFFPTDVEHVADHARRATTSFPYAGRYYGVQYDAREGDAGRIDWYRNIPVPTSYMVMSTDDEFFGGYDHGRDAGFVHWASRDVSPGKKQWTWGNAPFGWAWDANLTDGDGPYVELMAGVFTDNQPDFAWLAPGETKVFSQYWYPIQRTGPVQQANLRAAASLGRGSVAVAAPTTARARVELRDTNGRLWLDETTVIGPGATVEFPHSAPDTSDLTLTISDGGDVLLKIAPRPARTKIRSAAVEPPPPADVATVDQLHRIGCYLEQYRHATRKPQPYWQEAISRDPAHVGAHVALGAADYSAGLYHEAVGHFEIAVARETEWVPTPRSGEAHYRLGLALVRLGRDTDAAPMFARAGWDEAWRVPAWWALARLHGRGRDWDAALDRLDAILQVDAHHNQAVALRVRILRELGREGSAEDLLARDPLDQWALHLEGRALTSDRPTLLDIALEYVGAGFPYDALQILDEADKGVTAPGQVEVLPLVAYHRAAIFDRLGGQRAASIERERASKLGTRHALPSRLDDIAALEGAGHDATAMELLGHWYYDRGRHNDAIMAWTSAIQAGLDDSQARAVVLRNLGVASYNFLRDPDRAKEHYEAAIKIAPHDSRLWFELDQLLARSGVGSSARLARLEGKRQIVAERDDLTVVFANLLVDVGRGTEALELLASRRFQPWEGGEGQVLAAWEQASLAVAAGALADGTPEHAISVLTNAIEPPKSLGEARHPLANVARLHLAIGDALTAADLSGHASWRLAARAFGDFTGMQTRQYSEQTAYSILALRRLGEHAQADTLFDELSRYTEDLAATAAEIDFFATSLPALLLFVDDPQREQDRQVARLRERLRRIAVEHTVQSSHSLAEGDWQ